MLHPDRDWNGYIQLPLRTNLHKSSTGVHSLVDYLCSFQGLHNNHRSSMQDRVPDWMPHLGKYCSILKPKQMVDNEQVTTSTLAEKCVPTSPASGCFTATVTASEYHCPEVPAVTINCPFQSACTDSTITVTRPPKNPYCPTTSTSTATPTCPSACAEPCTTTTTTITAVPYYK